MSGRGVCGVVVLVLIAFSHPELMGMKLRCRFPKVL